LTILAAILAVIGYSLNDTIVVFDRIRENLFSLFIFGGKIINGFALALIIGVVIGTYSSIFVASTTVLKLGITKEDLMPVEKEGAEIDSTP